MRILYFANFREKMGLSEEIIILPSNVSNVRLLVEWLSARNELSSTLFTDHELIRVAVNQEIVEFDTEINSDDEVAFFPPMTGG
ncbi:MAG: molybdopterin converting factor subunit 1 [Rhodospirillaceae bacterium]|nr:molybdopterin converting factor subunit 1 [Rhodospirillaceae bacterium]OUT79514.1 MAG: molybdopterin converting factor subunit 1 [Rhodospirillaceae bacterium TMED23]|tara:strand:- start:1023 stop:1274 length:252 start_codon:yes stop_codon:yes gene_type:complete